MMPVGHIAQLAHPVDRERRRALLTHLIKSGEWRQVLVFSRTKHGANRIAEQLTRDGIDADAIHGNKSQGARIRAFTAFKEDRLRVLVVTDISARSLDLQSLPHVVNYDLPNVAQDYPHRIACTGGNGAAVALVCGEERELLAAIEKLMQCQVERKIVEGFEPGPGYETARYDPDQARGRPAGEPGGEPIRNPARNDARGGATPPRNPRPAQEQGGPRRNGGQRGAPRGDGTHGESQRGAPPSRPPRDPDAQPFVAAARHTDEFASDEAIDQMIDGNRVDYRGAPAVGSQRNGGRNNAPGARQDFRGGQNRSRGARPAATLEGPMTWRGEPVSRGNRPPEPHESRLHEYATRPQNAGKPGDGRKRRNGASLAGLPRDEE